MQKTLPKYKITNWSEYNKALINRGSITVWIEETSLKKWYSSKHTMVSGRPEIYSDDAILLLLVLRERFGLTFRSLQGFAQSILLLMQMVLQIPCYTQICKRAKTLNERISCLSKRPAKDIILDSTGIKVYGEGEWKVRTHGKSKRRVWRKLHIGIDATTQDIVVCELTGNDCGEAAPAVRMLDKIPGKLKTVRGDGAYDPNAVRKKIAEKGARAIIPPPRHATIKNSNVGWIKNRDEDIAAIYSYGDRETGRRPWKESVGYFKRSLVETAMLRIKKMLGYQLKSRILETQRTEAFCKCLVINKMNELGMPRGVWV